MGLGLIIIYKCDCTNDLDATVGKGKRNLLKYSMYLNVFELRI